MVVCQFRGEGRGGKQSCDVCRQHAQKSAAAAEPLLYRAAGVGEGSNWATQSRAMAARHMAGMTAGLRHATGQICRRCRACNKPLRVASIASASACRSAALPSAAPDSILSSSAHTQARSAPCMKRCVGVKTVMLLSVHCSNQSCPYISLLPIRVQHMRWCTYMACHACVCGTVVQALHTASALHIHTSGSSTAISAVPAPAACAVSV